jgi:CLIP-associating protein 1/2
MMGGSVDWQRRIYALQQLEGLVLGGAHDFDNFSEQLKGLRDALTAQLNDRCGRPPAPPPAAAPPAQPPPARPPPRPPGGAGPRGRLSAACCSPSLPRRRSAVSRQACHLLEVLAQDLGVRFEPFAAIFVPVLFRVLVITVQVRRRTLGCAARPAFDT